MSSPSNALDPLLTHADGTVLVGASVNNLNIGAYAFLSGSNDKFLGANCSATAQATIPWLTRRDCAANRTYFIPKSGGSASITNGPLNGVTLECDPGIINSSFSADAGSGPASAFIQSERQDGYNLVYTGNPIPINSGEPRLYTIELGFVGSVQAFLQSFNVSVSVALCLYDVMTRLHKSDYSWQLSEDEKQDLLLKWIYRVSKTAVLLRDGQKKE